MKKFILVLSVISLIFTLFAGCSGTEGSSTDGTHTTTTTTATTTTTTTAPQTEDPNNSVQDETNPKSDFEYVENEDGGITITKYIGTDDSVVIPEAIDGKPITVIGYKAFISNKTIVSVVMPDTVKIISEHALATCPKLKSVTLSKNLEQIDYAAFHSCAQLSAIELPDSLYYIGGKAFVGCTSLKQLIIPSNCFGDFQIQKDAISADGGRQFFLSGIETLVLEEGVKYIPAFAFSSTQIKEVAIPSSVETIDNSAFSDCEQLEKVTLNEGLITINQYAFKNTKLTELIIPSTVNRFDWYAIGLIDTLDKLYFKGNAPEDFANYYGVASYSDFVVYRHEEAEGFDTSSWQGFTVEIWE